MTLIRRGAALLLNLLLLQFTLAGSGLLGCEPNGMTAASHAAGHGAPCHAPAQNGHHGDCSPTSIPAGCAAATCAAPAAAARLAIVASAPVTHAEPLGADDLAPASRLTAPEPPPPRV